MPRPREERGSAPRKDEDTPVFRRMRAVRDPKTGKPRLGPSGRPVAYYVDPPREPDPRPSG
jgi:hypothetical protein